MDVVISKLLPIIILILIGFFIRQINFVKAESIADMKRLVINVALPAVLFNSFANMEFGVEHLGLIGVVIAIQFIVYNISLGLNRISFLDNPLLPFTTSGSAYFLWAVPLFIAIFGIENSGEAVIIGLGHELYYWVFLLPAMSGRLGNKKMSFSKVISIFKTPMMISIIIGLLLNLSGIYIWMSSKDIFKGIFSSMVLLAGITTPLILIIVGYGIKLDKKYFGESLKLVITRLVVFTLIAYSIKVLFIDKYIETGKYFEYVFFTFVTTPLPFAFPIFVGEFGDKGSSDLASNMVAVNTMISMSLFILFIVSLGLN